MKTYFSAPLDGTDNDKVESKTLWGFRRFVTRWQNIVALIIVGLFIFVALDADYLAPRQNMFWASELQWQDDNSNKKPHPPDPLTPMGTIPVGRMRQQVDIFTGVINGSRSALQFGLITAFVTASIGVLVGVTCGSFGGVINGIGMRITDTMLAFPVIVGVFVIEQLFLYMTGNPAVLRYLMGGIVPESQISIVRGMIVDKLDPVMMGIILFSWMPYARLTNTVVLRLRQADFIEAARALGAGQGRIIFRHLLPNAISPAVVLFTRDIGGFVLLEAALGFIGFGGSLEWGAMLFMGRNWIIGPGGNIFASWWVFFPATLALILFGMGWGLLGDGINDWLNPRSNA